MKKILVLNFFVFCLFSSCNQEINSTYYFIRHAEKDRTDSINKDPNLTKIGVERAKKWANYFKDIPLDVVYITAYKRTMQTVKPIASSKNLKILTYNPANLYSNEFKKATQQKSVLIVGHSNTNPAFVNKIMDTFILKNMDDTDNSSLYIVQIQGKKKSFKSLKID